MTQYCSIKAAREMCSRVLAEEHKDVRVLNYSPGIVVTDMFHQINDVRSKSTRSSFGTEKRIIHQCHESVQVLLDLMKKNEFENASYVHIRDVLGK